MPLLSNQLYVFVVLVLLVVIAEWLGQKKYFHYLGSVLIVIIAAAILANIHVLPSSQDPSSLYDFIFSYIAPLAIFYLLLDVDLKSLKKAGGPMIILFLFGSICTIIGTLTGFYLLHPQAHGVDQANAVAGMYTGTYIGGSANLNAVGLHYGVNKNGNLFAAINAADNIISTIWIIVTIFLPRLLQRFFPRSRKTVGAIPESQMNTDTIKGTLSVMTLGTIIALGASAMLISQLIHNTFPKVPLILILTTIGIIIAQFNFVKALKAAKTIGYFLVLLFLAVVGAYCDMGALASNGGVAITLLTWVTIIVFVHGILLFGIAGIFRQDWDMISIASNANIGGATTAPVLASTLGRKELQVPGILVGSLGNAIGTYLGLFIAELIR